ncbi:MAG: DNA methyltransferase [Nostocales cyanobacterium LE14-WE4]|jgi:DNA modification methylase|nr:site-specific DNA-methyltransferase [Anabaena sp. 49633_E8]MCE2702622.1 site-specific DNA-methyltransferase [Anabaena sp. 49633_E8]MDJ0501304.1 DNA methyltransferase [Nostocales cyanobacterium LE14-WE4]
MKEWRKILSLASYYSGLSGQKSLWELADLTLNVQERWGKHPQYNLKSLSDACGISESRLKTLARTAKFFSYQNRFEELSITHHVTAMRQDPEKANFWLEQAVINKWSSKDIRLAIIGNGDPKKFSWLRCGTFWYFSHCDPRFGMNYPSRIPGQIPANVIHYYTDPNDLVVDLMAGGGSTLDAAKYLDRRCLAYDLVSIRSDIIENDALLGIPTEAKGAKLIFIDPPYGMIPRGFYNDHPHCLSRMDKTEFIEALTTVGNNCRQVLVSDGYLAILVQNVYGWEGDTVFQIMEGFIKQNWKLIRRIQVPISNQQIPPNVMKWARENRQMVNTDRDLLIFQMNQE